MGEEKSI